MNSKITCPVCSGSNYYKEAGFYFCNECHTQSQDIREEVLEDQAGAYIHSTTIKSSASSDGKYTKDYDWTTWEGYNFILKGLVDELISCGAPPNLKTVVLQLWVMYLKRLRIAFFSKKKEALPRLGLQYHAKDAQLIHGISKNRLRRKKPRKRKPVEAVSGKSDSANKFSDKDAGSSDGDKSLGSNVSIKNVKSKKALATAEYETYRSDNQDDVLSFLDDTFNTDGPRSVSSNVSTRSHNSSHISISLHDRKRIKYRKHKLKVPRAKLYDIQEKTDPRFLSRSRLVVILYLGLRLTQSDIFLGDILRWITEGVLSYHNVSHFFPNVYHIKGMDGLIFGPIIKEPSHFSLRVIGAKMAELIAVTTVPPPDILALVRRYILELQLPDQLLTYVKRLFAVSVPVLKFNTNCIPNYEARAMAFIIVVLKLLLGLDGVTEHKISVTARKINMLLGTEEPLLFVWDDWVKYIECRKAFVSLYHFPTKHSLYRDSYLGPELYIDQQEKTERKDDHKNEKIIIANKMNPNIVTALGWPFRKLSALYPDESESVEFLPTLTPYTSYLETIKTERFADTCPELLKRDFRNTKMKYLLCPSRYVDIALSKGINIVVLKRSAQPRFKHTQLKMQMTTFDNSIKRVVILDKPRHEDLVSDVRLQQDFLGTKNNLQENRKDRTIDEFRPGRIQKNRFANAMTANKDLLTTVRKHEDKMQKCNLNTKRKNNQESLDSKLNGLTNQIEESSHKKRKKEKTCAFKGKCKIKSLCDNLTDVDEKLNTSSSGLGASDDISGSLDHLVPGNEVGRCRTDDETKTKYKLYLPSSKYWMLQAFKSFYSPKNFDEEVLCLLPPSFRWLLTECASLTKMKIQSIYQEVLLVETLHAYILSPNTPQEPNVLVKHAIRTTNSQW